MNATQIVGVFGANGFIGRHLVRALIDAGLNTVAFGRQFPPDFQEAIGFDVETRRIDIMNELETHALLQGITHVVQLINTSNPAMGNKHLVSDLRSNVVPHVNFIESSIMAGVEHFVFISSGGTVYGIPEQKPIPETHPTEPLNSYGLGKLIVERYLTMLSRGTAMEFSTLRVSNPFGPGQTSNRGQGLIPAVLKQVSAGLPVSIFGNGQSERDYIFIKDVVDGIITCIERGPVNDVINIGSGEGRTVLQVVDEIEHILGRTIERQYVDPRATDTPSNVLDTMKARALLGWQPRADFHEAMRLTVNAYESGVLRAGS